MLSIGLKSFSERDLRQIIGERCAAFGAVKNIRILLPNPQRDYAIAAVDMRTPHEARKVPKDIADWSFASTVVIRILQEGGGLLPASSEHLRKDLPSENQPDVYDRDSDKAPGSLAGALRART